MPPASVPNSLTRSETATPPACYLLLTFLVDNQTTDEDCEHDGCEH
jgi:hypothetical protein